ncbi:bifunctional folylpolyglutamate synthase/dihydrofolate synthase [Butyrivibrio sp. MC2013]|uniref:bifunctional folylpolyglutamate synthase/dihydrofolate synthase n=1 Tax=Butyrivibrio sp. MC2013 TaxID=1280686 RepID=UPI0003F8DC89|nr:folylpolyglutamate synthase/dihydrofolate synthase family protein [Butyrivibrio sp. MC2013]
MEYEEAIAFYRSLDAFNPVKLARGEIVMNLESLTELLARLGNPHKDMKYIHIAGTNGKGSTAAFISTILTKAGYKTGLYTSPAVLCFEERIRVDGEYISREDVGRYTKIIKDKSMEMLRDGLRLPSEFEMVTAMSFMEFRDSGCDIAVMECGLGGIMDATNVIPSPELAIITSISYDHTEILGNSLTEIADKKAGIIKEGCDVLLYPQTDEDVTELIRRTARKEGASFNIASLPKEENIRRSLKGQSFDLTALGEVFNDMRISMLGNWQAYNGAMAVNAALILRQRGYSIPESAIREGLKDAKWPCRFELLGSHPYFIADGSHNPQGVAALADSLESFFPGQKVIFITGVLSDKAYDKMMSRVIPLGRAFITITPPSERALDGEKLREDLIRMGAENVSPASSIREAVELALELAGDSGVICAFGSLYYIGQIRELADEIRTGQ